MGKSGPSTPAAPDPVATAAAQTVSNKETATAQAQLNNMNQVTPYGTLTYTKTNAGPQYNDTAYQQALTAYQASQANPTTKGTTTAPKLSDYALNSSGVPTYTATTTLSPEEQQLYNLNTSGQIGTAQLGNDQLSRISNAVSTPYSYSGLPDAPTDATMAQSQAAGQQAVMDRLAPQEARDQASLNTTLSNQGVQAGSEAYNNAQDTLGRTQNDANQQAVLTGQQYATAGQAQALANRQQAITEYSAQRNAPLNEYSALVSGSQVQNPQFSGSGSTQIAPTNTSADVYNSYNAQVAQNSAKTAANNATTSGIFGLGGSLGAAALISDIRLKTNIKKIGKKNGHNWYSFKYLGDPIFHTGVMAQEVLKVKPEAVITLSSGHYAVNYGAL